jgi:hypothetical protein
MILILNPLHTQPPATPENPLERLEGQISRIWAHLNDNNHQLQFNIDKLAAAHDRILSLENLLSARDQRIKSLESDLSITLPSNLSYQKLYLFTTALTTHLYLRLDRSLSAS